MSTGIVLARDAKPLAREVLALKELFEQNIEKVSQKDRLVIKGILNNEKELDIFQHVKQSPINGVSIVHRGGLHDSKNVHRLRDALVFSPDWKIKSSRDLKLYFCSATRFLCPEDVPCLEVTFTKIRPSRDGNELFFYYQNEAHYFMSVRKHAGGAILVWFGGAPRGLYLDYQGNSGNELAEVLVGFVDKDLALDMEAAQFSGGYVL